MKKQSKRRMGEEPMDLPAAMGLPMRIPPGVPALIAQWQEGDFEAAFEATGKEIERTWMGLLAGKRKSDQHLKAMGLKSRARRLQWFLSLSQYRRHLADAEPRKFRPIVALTGWVAGRLGLVVPDDDLPRRSQESMPGELRERLEGWQFIHFFDNIERSIDRSMWLLARLWEIVGVCGDEAVKEVAFALWIVCDTLMNGAPLHLAGNRDPRIAQQFPNEDWQKWFALPFDPRDCQPFIATAMVYSNMRMEMQREELPTLSMDPFELASWTEVWRDLGRYEMACAKAVAYDREAVKNAFKHVHIEKARKTLSALDESGVPQVLQARDSLLTQLSRMLNVLDCGIVRTISESFWDEFGEWMTWIEDVAVDSLLEVEKEQKRLQQVVVELSQDALKHPDKLRKALEDLENFDAAVAVASIMEKEPVMVIQVDEGLPDVRDETLPPAGDESVQHPSDEPPLDSADMQEIRDLAALERQDLLDARESLAVEREKSRQAGERIAELQSQLDAQQVIAQAGFQIEPTQQILDRTPDRLTPEQALVLAAGARPLLRLVPSALESAHKAWAFRYGKRLLGLLLELGGTYAQSLAAGQPDTTARAVLGNSYKAGESDTTMSVKEFREARIFDVDGQPVLMQQHVGIGTSPSVSETIRVHFAWMDGKIVVGYVGEHLPTLAKA